jgi:hypothetical protein
MSQSGAERISDQYTPRERLSAMVARAELDPDGYGAQLRANPEAALGSIGLSDNDARSLLSQDRAADPGAALRAACFDTTCAISLCPGTCFVTVPALPFVCKQPGGGGCFLTF